VDTSEVMRGRRSELGLSQADLAQAAGLDLSQVQDYETGKREPLLSQAAAIADALKISVGELAGKPSHRVQLGGAPDLPDCGSL
jgi:transcriptional regulator with XRE-family HTH domain